MMHPQKNYSSCLYDLSFVLPSLELSQAETETVEDKLDVPTNHIYVNHQDLCDSYYKNTHLIFMLPLLALSQTTNSLTRLH